jgi:hypothetical protein
MLINGFEVQAAYRCGDGVESNASIHCSVITFDDQKLAVAGYVESNGSDQRVRIQTVHKHPTVDAEAFPHRLEMITIKALFAASLWMDFVGRGSPELTQVQACVDHESGFLSAVDASMFADASDWEVVERAKKNDRSARYFELLYADAVEAAFAESLKEETEESDD